MICFILASSRLSSLGSSLSLLRRESLSSIKSITALRAHFSTSATQQCANGSRKDGDIDPVNITQNGSCTQLRNLEDIKRRYLKDVFLKEGESGGHVIFASDDGVNPYLSEIRFARNAAYCNYPYVWFRDHCRCPSCTDEELHSKVSVVGLDPNIEPVLDETNTRGSSVTILWKDGHFSTYPADWLWAHQFGSKKPLDILDPSFRSEWDARKISNSLKRFNFQRLLEDDKLLFDWFLELRVRGLAVIEGAPEEPQQVHRLGDRVGFLKRCHFGLSLLQTIRHETHKNGGLSLETDMPYSSHPPGIHLLHCISQGGATSKNDAKLLIADGFHATEILREEERPSAEILAQTEWEHFEFGTGQGGKYHQRACHPAIRFDSSGYVIHVVFSDRLRGPRLNVPAHFVSTAYESLKKFVNILNRKEHVFEYTLKPGEIIARDNRRVLYRYSPIESADFESQLEGAYLDWDEINSKLRILFKEIFE